MNRVLFAFSSVALLLGLIGLLIRFGLRYRRTSRLEWSDIFDRLGPINRDGVRRVAVDLMSSHPGDLECSLSTSEVLELLGGLDGLETMAANSEVMIELAFFIQKWHPEAVEVTENLRRDAGEIKWHVDRLRSAAQRGNLETSYSMYAPKAAAVYCQMTSHLIQLYSATMEMDLHARLEAAI